MENKEAPYPADTKAKGWRFELDYEAIDQSGTWALAAQAGQEARPLLLMQWLVSWRQSPCGSLPSDEAVVAALIGVNMKTWAKYRSVLMRGWWLATDGLMYHPTITARVLEMIDYRKKAAERVAKHKAAKREQHVANTLPTGNEYVKNDTGTGTGTSNTTPPNGGDAPQSAAKKRGARLAEGWALPLAWGQWAMTEYPHWNADIVRLEADKFANHWHAKTGKDASKLDWAATWRNWCMSDICQRSHPPPGQGTETNYTRQMRERVEEATGSMAHIVAAKAPGLPRTPPPWEVAIENQSRAPAIGMDRHGVLEVDG